MMNEKDVLAQINVKKWKDGVTVTSFIDDKNIEESKAMSAILMYSMAHVIRVIGKEAAKAFIAENFARATKLDLDEIKTPDWIKEIDE